MRIGDLNRRVEIQIPTKMPDGMGGFINIFSTWRTVDAAIWPVSANEVVQANAVVMICSHRIRIRYLSILKPSWRLKRGNRYFNIVSIINPSESNRYLDLMVKEAT